MKQWAGWLVVAMTAAVALLAIGGPAGANGKLADPPTFVLGPDGETAPAYSYANAIRERVWVPVAGVDQNADGVDDRVALDIVRPLETQTQGMKVPAIIDVSPYYSSLGRGNESEFLHSSSATQADKFPLYYDNYYVPRGFAFIAAQAVGTAWSTGCPLHGGPGDVAGFKAMIDWLRGRVPAYNSRTTSDTIVTADWDNGKNAAFGKSYDGTFSNGLAATGVEGLTTIMPISAISEWYDYSRSNGARLSQAGSHYPASLSNTITSNTNATNLGVSPPSNNASCAASRTAMSAVGPTGDGDADNNINPFWTARDYNPSVSNVHASVFASHGLNDDNVKPEQFSKWWAGLAANNVPRKLWLSLEGHVDPFDYHRGTGVAGDGGWVDTTHKWLDFWLYGIDNGIMSEPRVKVETSTDVYADYADFPAPGTETVDLYLRASGTAGAAGDLHLASGGTTAARVLTNSTNQSENTMINAPLGSQTNRLVFISAPLTAPLRISGTPVVDSFGSFNRTTAQVGAVMAEYSPTTSFIKPTRSGDGITTQSGTNFDCFGDATATDDGCYFKVTKPTTTINPLTGTGTTGWRFSRGILDAVNRVDYSVDTPIVAGTEYELKWPLMPTDYIIPAGHRFAVTLVGDYSGLGVASTGTPTMQETLNTRTSKLLLPIVGGMAAAKASGAFPDVDGPTVTVPSDITAEATGPGGATVTFIVTVTDTEDPAPTVTCTPASGSLFAITDTTVSCDGVDAAGNHTVKTFHVIVKDTTAPSVDTPSNVTVEAAGPTGSVVTFASPASHDVVDGDGSSTCSPASGTLFAKGTTTVTCSKTDAHGNTGSSHFDVNVVDTTAPTTSASFNPAAPNGLNGWYITDPTATLTATDTASAVTLTEWAWDDGAFVTYNGPFQVCSAAASPCGPHIIKIKSRDAAGNQEAAKSVPVKIDLANPTSSASISPAIQNGWYATPTVTLSGLDPNGSGIDHISYKIDGEASWHTYSTPLSGFKTGNHFIQFQATDVSGRVESSVNLVAFKADSDAPSVTITRPAEGEVFALDKVVTAAFKCPAEGSQQSGILSCVGTVANGANLDTDDVGTHTFTVTATDKAGNKTTVTRHYQVSFTWNGFFSVGNTETSTLNLVHAGDLIKVGFGLNGNRGLNVLAAGSPNSHQVDCPPAEWTLKSIPAGGAGTTPGLTYGTASGHYTFGWSTSASWAGTCREFDLTLNDGSGTVHKATFMFFA